MPDYRCYPLDRAGAIIAPGMDFSCHGDHTAIARAREALPDERFEVWQGARRVHTAPALTPKDDLLKAFSQAERRLKQQCSIVSRTGSGPDQDLAEAVLHNFSRACDLMVMSVEIHVGDAQTRSLTLSRLYHQRVPDGEPVIEDGKDECRRAAIILRGEERLLRANDLTKLADACAKTAEKLESEASTT